MDHRRLTESVFSTEPQFQTRGLADEGLSKRNALPRNDPYGIAALLPQTPDLAKTKTVRTAGNIGAHPDSPCPAQVRESRGKNRKNFFDGMY